MKKPSPMAAVFVREGENALLQLVCDKPQTLKEFTENNYAQASFFWTALLKNKDVKVNGKKVGENVALQTGDTVCYYLTAKQESKPAYHILYEDENVLVVDKESGVNSEAVYAALSRQKTCYFVHRLDRNTKGLLVFGLTKDAEKALLKAFKERTAEKKYHALCFGRMVKDREVLTAYLKKDEGKSLVRVFDKPTLNAETIVTEYKVLQRMDTVTKLEVTLHTGKTHQIRAHLAHVGHPIVGDMKYGNSMANKAKNLSRQCLIAKSLRLCLEGDLSYLNDKTFRSNFEIEIVE